MPFSGSFLALVTDQCTGCGACVEHCKYGAIKLEEGRALINPFKCEGCGVYTLICKSKGIIHKAETTGNLMVSKTPLGQLSHAELYPGADGSGKMVTAVRKNAEKLRGKHHLIYGSPGINCVVMASVTGCDMGILVTEPTISALEDLKRINELMSGFEIPVQLVINKYDINKGMTDQLMTFVVDNHIKILGSIPFDPKVQEAINKGVPVVTMDNSEASIEIQSSYRILNEQMQGG